MTSKWQTTPSQRPSFEIDRLVADYAARLAAVHTTQVKLYRALLETDNETAERAAGDLATAVYQLPPIPDWPDTDEELITRLRGNFTPYVSQDAYVPAA